MKKGLVVLTGRNHHGTINIIKRAQKVSGINKTYAVIGGFHISSANKGMKVAEFPCRLGVKLGSTCHCTHNRAKIEL